MHVIPRINVKKIYSTVADILKLWVIYKYQTGTIYLDISEAFDSLSDFHLLDKLKLASIR